MLGTIKAVIQIIRPVNFLITFFSIVVACLICSSENYLQSTILIAALTGALVASGGNVINDIFDIEIDRINRPQRVLPSGLMNKKGAIFLYFILNVAAFLLGSMLNNFAFIIVILSAVVVFLYSWKFKKIPLFGNTVVALLTALTFIFGGISVNNWRNALIPAAFALIVNFIREIVKDIEDLEGDSRNNVITFPAKYGVRSAVKVIFVSTAFLISFTLIPFILNYYKIEYFIVIMITVNVVFVYFLRSLLNDQSRENLGRLSSVLKINMALGLLSIYLGK